MYKIYLYGISVFLFSFCNNNGTPVSNEQTVIQKNDSFLSLPKIDTLINTAKIKNLELSKIKTIKVLSYNRSMTGDTVNNEFFNPCKKWSLSENDVATIFQMLEPISRHEFNYQFYVLPCEINGTIELDGQKVPFLINAGSYMKLFGVDTTLIFGCSTNNCNKFFLTGKEKDNN
ncbi:MAG TPA: hypothetical protein PKD85_10985 [Saprospiraceae bacterium]|nr:hypothetical protein [Saprospiraceae bacterium]